MFESGVAVLDVRVADVAHDGGDGVGAGPEGASVVHETDGVSQEVEEVRLSVRKVQSGAGGCVKGFVKCFLEVQLACLGNMAAAVQPTSLGTLRKHVTKPFPQPAAPDCK